jgi:hypothetical protein
MSSSSRSIAAARQKRAGEQSQPMNNSRPVTSISSQSVFAQQQYQQQMMSQSIPVGSKNVRIAQNRSQAQGGRGSNQNIQQQQQQDQSTKISVSNAIGLITLRLGKLEKMITEGIEDGGFNNNENNDHRMSSIPPNMKLVTDEVFENIVNRLNLLESKVINNQTEISDIKTTLDNFSSLLSSFINDTNDKFIDYENALTEIENNFAGENNVKDEIDNAEAVEIVEEESDDTLENIDSILNENNENQ